MLARRIVLAALVLAAFAVFGTQQVSVEGASPPLHLQASAVSETAARFHWIAGEDNEWYCLDFASTPDDLETLSGTWFNSGCGMTGTSHLVKGLQCSATYYTRLYASTPDGGMYSPPLRVDMNECASTISEPTGMRTLFSTAHTVRLAWDAGDNNIWFCVEMATDLSELQQKRDSWVSLGCGTTENELAIEDLECETVYVWRVITWNFRVDTFSEPRTVITADCEGRLRSAPVESVTLRENGADYSLDVVVTQADGCLSPGSYSVEREGTKIAIRVRNIYIEPLTTCADIPGTHRWTISLGNDLVEGQIYEVAVNGTLWLLFRYSPPQETY